MACLASVSIQFNSSFIKKKAMYIASPSVHDLKPGSRAMGRITALSLLLFNEISCVLCT